MRAARSHRGRGQPLFAAGTVFVIAVTLVLLDRQGPKTPAAAVPSSAASGAWICPHGGGEGWRVAIFLANPGSTPVTARVTELGNEEPARPEGIDVPGGGTVRVDLEADGRGRSTYVEYFGGWLGAGWVITSGGDQPGTGAEPCAPEAARRWYLADGTTGLGEDAYVVVSNPFAAAAVLDVALYTPDRAPIRDSDWSDLVVPAQRSIALHLNAKVEGEPAVGVELDVSVGRVAAASLGVTDGTRLRSALGRTEPSSQAVFPSMQGSGRSELVLLSTADRSLRFGATALTEGQPRPAGGLTEQEQPAASARVYPIELDDGPVAVQLFTLDDATVTAALRVLGPGEDPAATSGSVSLSTSWAVLPAAADGPANPGMVLLNPGDDVVTVAVAILPREGGTAAAPISVEVPAHTAAAVPPGFLETAPGAAVLVRAEGGPIAALAASTSLGKGGLDTFALSMGVPLPQRP